MKRVAVLALLVLAGCGSLGASQPHTLSLGFKAGQTYKYKFHATSKQTAGMGGMSVPVEIDTSANETVTVNSVDASGVADLSISLGDFTLKTVAAGVTNTTTGLPSNSVDVKLRSDGTVVSLDGNVMANGSPLAAFAGVGGGYFIAAVFPDHPVKVGDTWTKTYDQRDSAGSGFGIHIVSDSRYLRDETVNGVNAAVVETKSTGTLTLNTPTRPAPASSTATMNGTFTTDVTTWIDPDGHRVIKSHSTSTDDLTITLPVEGGAQPAPGPFPIDGPLTAKGQGTADLSPA